MKAKSVFLEIVWYSARVMVYTKRAFVFLFQWSGKGLIVLKQWYKKTLGFLFFKIGFYLRKRLFPEAKLGKTSSWYWFGQRWILQIVGLLVAFFFIIPHTKLYKQDFGEIPGRKTVLYALVGSGLQNFQEDISKNESDILPLKNSDHIVTIESPKNEVYYSTTISGAVIKPIIYSPKAGQSSKPDSGAPINQAVVTDYTVKSGDIIGSIAKEHKVSVQTILLANNLSARSLIRAGDVLKIPAVDGVLHTIVKNDTIGKIAKQYNVSGDDIKKFNAVSDKTLKIGKQILVPGATKLLSKPIASRPVVQNKPSKPVIQNNIPASAATGDYIWPSGARIITQYYGFRHTGLDIAGSLGLPNYAARDGVVIKSQDGYNGGYGKYIIIDHGDGIQTLYAHNEKRLVSVGDYVSQGQVIGLLGSSGRSTGPHLHFEVRIRGRHLNPLQFIRR